MEIAAALRENTSIEELSVGGLPTILQHSFMWENLKAANGTVKDLTLRYKKVFFDVIEGRSVLAIASNQTFEAIRLLEFPLKILMEIVESLKTNTTIQVLDIGGSLGYIDKAFPSALLDLVRNHCRQIIDLGIDKLPQDLVRDNLFLKESLPSLHEQLRLNREYGQILSKAEKGPPRSARVVLCGPGYAGTSTY